MKTPRPLALLPFSWLRPAVLAVGLLATTGVAGAPPAQEPARALAPADTATRPLPADQATPLPARRPDAARLRELRGQRDFDYAEAVPHLSAWDLFWARLWQRVQNWLQQRSYTHFWRWVFYALFVAAGVFVVLKLLQVDLTGVFGRGPRRGPLAYDAAAEDIHAVDFTARLAEAEATGNFRLGVRLGYLQLLKQLADGGFIDWQPNKTNHAYLAELPAQGPLRADFREITRQFEYVWYGELGLTAGQYAHVRTGHRALAGQLAGGPAHRPA
ncbi:DUF4129 domain-containing protein [Hymenobacter sp. PAMC 26628]|uniref:DUF4129 domain-containing protein n=1 Tax=Hymenobacter sp. PAMC 26628 TaxID=1484118 RepID=UPI0007702033|nr:DUF4129 domain-containing protein [Hymenobacter sp. PAMC 26628]AMJ66723.1 hypothetical protein AXW84_15765 [Hymenobacter sp. PAMC 26628]